jgi:DNA-directed RNA polymerase specialized sigma24 family protein
MHQDPGNISDQELIDGFLKHRSEREFRLLYRKYAAGLHRLALHLVNYDRLAADDVAQESWITAVKKLDSFQGASSFKTWLTGILIYKVKEHQKTLHRSHEDLVGIDRGHAPSGYPGIEVDLQRSLAGLSDGYHQVLVLHDAEGYTHREIGELLGISEGTSKSQLFQARKQVQKFFNA